MSKLTRAEANKIAEKKFPHPTEEWKRKIWVKKILTEQEMTAQQLMDIHVILENMASLTSNQGTDSTPEEKKQFKKDYKELVDQIKEISPDYYKTIKCQDP
jgi:hypothetical protein